MPRQPTELRLVTIEPFATHAPGSVVIAAGETRVLCTASIADTPPKWLPRDPETGAFTRGWVTAEYNMLPASTPDRIRRGPNSRGTEIQRLIGRSLRAAVDLDLMPGAAITVDCDVLRADGGTRTAAITGGFVALRQAIDHARANGLITDQPVVSQVAAVSVGIVNGTPHLDLDYPLDSTAEVDMNVVMNDQRQYVEVQGTGEQGVFDRDQLNTLLDLANDGIDQLMVLQRAALTA
ncbi:MAG: ribonuclease PH [Planctomycetota bacterium]